MQRNLSFGLSLTVILGMIAMVPTAKADEWNKRTVVTFHEPVEIPGHVLTPGTYVMKLLDNTANRDIVQILNKDETQVIDTVMAITDYRQEATGKTVINFEERSKDNPEAIKDWFYPGDLYGVEFVYPNYHPAMTANSKMETRPKPQYEAKAEPEPAHPAPAPAAEPAPAPAPAQAQVRQPAPQPPPQMAMAKPEPAPAPAPAPAPQEQSKPATTKMPKTASDLPLAASLGSLALIAGLLLRKRTNA
jgi:hypothetical protein